MSAEYPGASWVACPGFGFPTGAHGGNHPRWIVLHGTASGDGTAEQQAQFFSGATDHGVHFVIGKDGKIIQLVQLADAAYGNGGPTAQELAEHKYADFWDTLIAAGDNLNTVTVSIEHCKESPDNSDILTSAQQAASFALVKWLCQRLNIPARPADASGGITGHFSINGIERVNCPGPYPWNALWAFLNEPAKAGEGGNSGMLIQHPSRPGRVDLVYVGTDSNGDLWHNWNDETTFATLAHPRTENWGKPAGRTLIPWSAGGCWSADGAVLQVAVASEPDGQIFLKSVNYHGTTVVDWTPVAGQTVKPS